MARNFYPAFLLVASLLACEAETATEQELPLESFRNEVEATRVKVAHSERRSFDYLINASGKVEAREQVRLIATRTGYLSELSISEGAPVSAGETVAVLDRTESSFNLEKAKARLRNARATYSSDILSFPEIMGGEDSLRRAVIDEQVRSSSGLLMAEIELREAEMDMEKSVIKTPIAGRVADISLKEGSPVSAGDIICEVLSADALDPKVLVLEADIGLVAPGQQAEVHPVAGRASGITGTVRTINPKVDENGLVQVTLALPANSGLLPGMNARAVIRAPQANSIVVPKAAVVYRNERPVVFTIENNESKWNYVETGMDNGREIQILDGVPPNTTVIVTNNLQLAHQAPVQVIKE